ncbi:MAG: Rieske 2Fe-2S domain-containing protein [Planctomycetaceae bacterium]
MPPVPICTRAELQRRRSVTKWIDELRDEVVLLWLDGAPVAYSSVCPHFGGPLEANFRDRTLTCPWHGWRFDLADGRCLTHSMKCTVRRYQVIDRAGELCVAVENEGSPPTEDVSSVEASDATHPHET